MTDASVHTYSQVLASVCQAANYLKSVGVKKGDDVTIYMPMVVELPVIMLACARIGAVHSVVFGGFSAEALADRIMDSKPNVRSPFHPTFPTFFPSLFPFQMIHLNQPTHRNCN